jgi:hypothetical protein
MTLEELLIATELEDQKDSLGKNSKPNRLEDVGESQPEWGTTDIEELKKGDDPLKRAAKAVTSALMQ